MNKKLEHRRDNIIKGASMLNDAGFSFHNCPYCMESFDVVIAGYAYKDLPEKLKCKCGEIVKMPKDK